MSLQSPEVFFTALAACVVTILRYRYIHNAAHADFLKGSISLSKWKEKSINALILACLTTALCITTSCFQIKRLLNL